MPENITLDVWMLENRWTNTTMAKRLTENGYKVHHSTISQIRHKKIITSGRLAQEIYLFTERAVSLEEILGIKSQDTSENKP
ncbi:MAG: hypothetical protein H8D96_06065 [Desulfobacterales bacterium]|uniref:Uncharacterized protein n=1 Tax=Candidatus Desulfatibia vada TaxID=2841696 RepID=A0A8J6TQK5_9BACT|nr:hypothetical protein [Candidatus Desulfatibia vada]